jgi:hypothetical protein
MADIDAVAAALDDLLAQSRELDDSTRRKIPDRTVSLWVKDLDVAYSGRLLRGHLLDVTETPISEHPDAQLRLAMSSDDLVDLVQGRLSFGTGWAKGRIRVDARLRDVLELRRFL